MPEKIDKFILEPEAVKQVEAYGIPYPEHSIVKSAQEAVIAADKIGYPVVMKIVSPDVLHKSDVGGVIVGVDSAKAIREGYKTIVANVKNILSNSVINDVLICSQAKAGVEVIVGATKDPVFGMTLMFGLGGIFTEVLKDVVFRSIPIEPIDAEEMIKEIKGYPMLTGVRGQSPCDFDKLVKLLLSISQFIADRPDIVELDLNPVRVYPDGVQAIDVRMISRKEKK